MTHEQMVAWLILEGWECCGDGGQEHYPAAFNKAKDESYVIWSGRDLERGVYGDEDTQWIGITTWDKMRPEHVRRLFEAITGETK